MFGTLFTFCVEAITRVCQLGTWLTTPQKLIWFKVNANSMIINSNGTISYPSGSIFDYAYIPPIYLILGGLVVSISVLIICKILKIVWDAIPIV